MTPAQNRPCYEQVFLMGRTISDPSNGEVCSQQTRMLLRSIIYTKCATNLVRRAAPASSKHGTVTHPNGGILVLEQTN